MKILCGKSLWGLGTIAVLAMTSFAGAARGQVLSRLGPSSSNDQWHRVAYDSQPSMDQVRNAWGEATANGQPLAAEDQSLHPVPARQALAASSGYGECYADQIGGGACCPDSGSCGCLWFASGSGLFMTRDNENPYLFSYDDANEAIQLTNARDANFNWAGGGLVSFGRYFNCGCNALEAVYWGLFPESNSTVTTAADVTGNLNGILNFDQLDYNGATADTFVNNAQSHAVFRDSEVHNVELNLLSFGRSCAPGSCGSGRLSHHWLAGARFFKFRDDLSFAADTVDQQFTGAAEELYYDVDIDNNLVGFQLGGLARYAFTGRLRLDLGLKVGVYGNHISHRSRIGGAAGVATINNGPNNGAEFLVDNSKDDVAMLSEALLGLNYCLSDRWSVIGGYRAVAITGVALPTNQIFPDVRGLQDVQIVDSNGSLILHGGYLGVAYNF